MQQTLWQVFMDKEPVTMVTWDHFHDGLRAAIHQTNVELKRPYEKAVLRRADEFEDVVWSTADGDDQLRSLGEMYNSFSRIVTTRLGRKTLDQKKYSEMIRALKLPAYGEVMAQVPGRTGWYMYREKMLRGYVRMQAEVNKVSLSGERKTPKSVMHIGNSRTGYYGPSVPRGVRLIGDEEV
jgi:hypothetical protein